MLAWGCLVLIPINKTDNELTSYQAANSNFVYSAVDTISIANVHDKSKRYVSGMLVECRSPMLWCHGSFYSRLLELGRMTNSSSRARQALDSFIDSLHVYCLDLPDAVQRI